MVASDLAVDTIVVPQGLEYQAVCRGLRRMKATVRVVAIPLGCNNIRDLADVWQQLASAKSVLIMGLAGSLDRSYRVGDGVLVQSCQNLACQRIYFDRPLTTFFQQQLDLDIVEAFTSERIVVRAEAKQRLADKYRTAIVEMEGYCYVRELRQKGKSVAMLRVVSDDLTGDIPDLSKAIDRQGKIESLAMAIAFAKQPVAAVRLIRGSLTGLKALEKLAGKLNSIPHQNPV